MKSFVLVLSYGQVDFRQAEIAAVMQMLAIPGSVRPLEGSDVSFPALSNGKQSSLLRQIICLAEFPSEDDLLRLLSRVMLVRYAFEIWGTGATWAACLADTALRTQAPEVRACARCGAATLPLRSDDKKTSSMFIAAAFCLDLSSVVNSLEPVSTVFREHRDVQVQVRVLWQKVPTEAPRRHSEGGETEVRHND
jgi:hypothetical protein